MLAKKRYARHALQDKAIPILFLSLVLISLTYPSIKAGSISSIPLNYVDIESEEVETTDSGIILSANSKMPVGRTGLTWIVRPDGRLRWYLYNPDGGIAFYKDVEEIHETAPGEGWIDDPDISVPWFPTQGQWKISLVVKGPFFGIIEKTITNYVFNIGESSITDNIMAPIYWTWGGFPVVRWGAFSIALPGIFWLTSPLWIFAIFFILLALYKRSIKLTIALIKESGKRFREAWT